MGWELQSWGATMEKALSMAPMSAKCQLKAGPGEGPLWKILTFVQKPVEYDSL